MTSTFSETIGTFISFSGEDNISKRFFWYDRKSNHSPHLTARIATHYKSGKVLLDGKDIDWEHLAQLYFELKKPVSSNQELLERIKKMGIKISELNNKLKK